MVCDIFICYTSMQRDLAMEIYSFYQQNNYKCWIAPNDIKDAGRYHEEILDAIKASSMMLFISSEESNSSPYAHDEIRLAFENNIPILVFPIDESIFDTTLEFYMENQYFLKNQIFIYTDERFPREELLKQASSLIGERSFEIDGLSGGVSKQYGAQSKSEIPEIGYSSIYPSYSPEDFFESEKFQNLGYKMAENIGKNTVLVSFISKNSIKSCLDDIEKAFKDDLPIILVYLENVEIKFGLKFKIKYRSKIKELKNCSINKSDVDRYLELLDEFGLKRDVSLSVENISSEDANNFKYLDDLVKKSKNVALTCDIAFDESDPVADGIEISGEDIVIDGCGHSIDGRGKSRIFDVNGKNIVFKNIFFINGSDSTGGAVKCSNSSVTFKNCIFENNKSGLNGGAIFQEYGNVKILNCEFKDNNSEIMGGALQVENGVLEIADSKINNSNSRYGGAIRANNTTLILTNSSICNCSSRYGGGINYNNGEIKITKCCFSDNKADGNGGAIETQNGVLDIKSTKFLNNKAKYGSAVRNHAETTIQNSSFRINSSEEGVIFNEKGSLDILNCRFEENHPDGDVIYNEDYLNVNDSIFCDNNARNIILNLANSSISTSKFLNNDCKFIIKNEGKSTDIFKCNFKDNNANIDILNESDLTLKEVKGESKFILNNKNIFIKDFDNDIKNQIENHGNIEFQIRNDENFDFTYLDELIRNCESNKIILNEDILCKNYERDFYEGGIVLEGDELVIDGNNHMIDGGGISRIFTVTALNVRLKNIIFKNGHSHKNDYQNPQNNNGGAIRINSKSNLECINCKFLENTSEDKGGAIDNRGGILSLNNCELIGNSSEFVGGAIINQKYGKANIINTDFKENLTQFEGGAIENRGIISLDKSVFCENSSKNGGAIENKYELSIQKSVFENNHSSSGGAILNNRDSILKVESTLFKENHADDGGAIENRGLELILSDCELEKNTSKNDGGAIYSFYSDNFTVKNCILNENSCRGSGGGIWNFTSNSRLKLINSRLKNNYPEDIFEK